MNNVKRIVSVLLIILVCFSLCSCQELDDLKNRTATWVDETKEEINFRNKKYKKLDVPEYLSYELIDAYEHGFVTESDVPVLLAEGAGDYMSFAEDATILYVWLETIELYCIEGKYNSIQDLMEKGEFDNYGYYRFDYETYENGFHLVSDDIRNILNEAFKSEKVDLGAVYDDCNIILDLLSCDDDAILDVDAIGVLEYENVYYVSRNYYDDIENISGYKIDKKYYSDLIELSHKISNY